MVGAQTITVDAAERWVGVTPPQPVDDGYLLDAAFAIATTHPLAAASAVVARHAYEAVGGFHTALAHTNDWEMWTRVASYGPVAWVDEPMALYRSHPESDSNRLHSSTAYIDECLEAVEIMVANFDDADRRRLVRRGARTAIAGYSTAVAFDMLARDRRRLAVANAARAFRVNPSIHTCSQATEISGRAVASALRDRGRRMASTFRPAPNR
jgi:hypothetical protein